MPAVFQPQRFVAIRKFTLVVAALGALRLFITLSTSLPVQSLGTALETLLSCSLQKNVSRR